jgi:hypothetical protein
MPQSAPAVSNDNAAGFSFSAVRGKNVKAAFAGGMPCRSPCSVAGGLKAGWNPSSQAIRDRQGMARKKLVIEVFILIHCHHR